MNDCFSTLLDVVNNNQSCVLVTVAHVAGSAPREAGARMIVTPAQVLGTIGGGNLEFEAIRIARSRLDEPQTRGSQRFIELFPLGSMLQQCCGGAVFLHFEVVKGRQAGWVSAAADSEQNNIHALLVSRTIQNESDSPVPFPRKRESSGITPADSGRYSGAGPASLTEKMIFTETGITGSLGDKDLDALATAKAAALLSAPEAPQTSLLYPLVETQSTLPDISDVLFFEAIRPCDFQVVLFGAGHVGRALVSALAGATPCRITWVDSRAGQFPQELPSNVEPRLTDNPVAEIDGLSGQAYCLVMTHSHQLDQDLCEALLRRDNLAFIGLIGSATKHRRFVQRLGEKGLGERQLERLTCPIGIPGIESKEPGVIAVSVAAQLLKIKSADLN